VNRSCVIIFATSLLCACSLSAQQKTPAATTSKLPKLCVAAVGNGSLKPIQVNQVKDELMKDLLATGLNAEAAATTTLVAKKLELSGNNRESIHLRKCDYMLLTSVDSATAGKEGAPGSGNQLLLSFALFKNGVVKPLIDTALSGSDASTPTQSILDVVPKESDQVHTVLSKK
jgi:hypothetical protein